MDYFRVYIFRHGETDWNAEGRIQGHLDVPLNDLGRSQARRLIQPLSSLGIEAILSSDLCRASETADIIAEKLRLPVLTDPGLREIHLGQAQGLTHVEIAEKFGGEFASRLRNAPLSDADIVQLGSESGEQVVMRATASIMKLRSSRSRVAVASHGGVIRRLIQNTFGPASEFVTLPIANGAVYPLVYDLAQEKWRLETSMPLASLK